MDTAIVLMDKVEAREITDRIKANLVDTSELVFDMYNREGWRALGYESWRACVVAEFEFSQSHAYRLLSHGQVVKNIKDSQLGNPDIILPATQHQTEPLAKLPPKQQSATWQKVQKVTEKPQPTAKEIETVIAFSKHAQVNRGKGTKQSVNTSGGSWGSGAGIDAEFERGGDQSPGAAGFTLEELQTLLAEYDNGDQCPYCGK